ncbi:MAG: hypothetical protein ACK419_07870 [Pyrinomonadaceae bacterium]
MYLGSIAKDSKEETVLIDGDSETCASIIASRLQAKRVELIMDQVGIFSVDPGNFPSSSVLLNQLSYQEVRYYFNFFSKFRTRPWNSVD